MLKATQPAIRKTKLPSVKRSNRSDLSAESTPLDREAWQTREERVLLSNVNKDDALCDWDLPFSVIAKPKRRARASCDSVTPPSTPSSPQTEELLEFQRSSWKAFIETPNGDPDPNIVFYKCETEAPSDFVPFDLDRYLALQLLHELNLDPSLAP